MAGDTVDVPDGGGPSSDRVGDLLRRVADGDETAFARVYDATSARSFGDIMSVVGDQEQAEAALHIAYLEVWRTAGDYTPAVGGIDWVRELARRTASPRRSVGEVEGDAAAPGAGDEAAEVAPPLTARSTLLAQISETPQGDDPPPATRRAAAPQPARERVSPAIDPAPTTNTLQAIERTNWTRGLLAFVAAMLVLVGLGWGSVAIHEQLTRTPADTALAAIENAPDSSTASADLADGGRVTARWSESAGESVIVTDDLTALDEDQTYQVWAERDDERTPLGTFEVESEGTTVAQLDEQIETGDLIMITVEPVGGSESGEPSAEPVVTIQTA